MLYNCSSRCDFLPYFCSHWSVHFTFRSMQKAIEDVLNDESFHVQLEPAATALKQATCLFKWASDNQEAFGIFETSFRTHLRTCLLQDISTTRSYQNQRVDMWRKYHSLRISKEFVDLWKELISKAMSEPPEPTFFQDITDRVFEEMVVTAFPLKEPTPSCSETDITYDDARYIAGYVCRKVRTKIEKSSCTDKAVLIKCLEGLLSDEEEDAATASADWVDVVDRGGLLHVKEGTYMLFVAMEEEVREHFRIDKTTAMVEGNREQVENAVMENDDILFHWCIYVSH